MEHKNDQKIATKKGLQMSKTEEEKNKKKSVQKSQTLPKSSWIFIF